LADTLADRSVVAELKRRRPSDIIARLRIGRMQHLHELRRRIVRWVADHEERIAERDPEIPSIIDREADNWQVLLAIADEAGEEWPGRARKVAVASHGSDEEGGDNVARLELLLWDIRNAFDEEGTEMADMFGATQVIISSKKLVKILGDLEGHPWAEMGRERKAITPNILARMLRPLGIVPGKVGPEKKRLNGYVRAHFEDAFERYLSPRGANSPDSRQMPMKWVLPTFRKWTARNMLSALRKGKIPITMSTCLDVRVIRPKTGERHMCGPQAS